MALSVSIIPLTSSRTVVRKNADFAELAKDCVVYLIVTVISGTQEVLSRLESKHWLVIGDFILLLITIDILANNIGPSRSSDYYDVPHGRVHTDWHY